MSGPQLAILLIGAGGGAFLLSMILTRIAMPLAHRIGYVDHPGGHKSHESPTCYGGGVAIFLATWIPMVLALLIVGLAGETWLEERFGHATSVYLGGLGMRAGSAWLILGGGLILHVMGLVSRGTQGDIHASMDHLVALLKLAKHMGLGAEQVKMHVFTDGRDSAPQSAPEFLEELQRMIAESFVQGRQFSFGSRVSPQFVNGRLHCLRCRVGLTTGDTGPGCQSHAQKERTAAQNRNTSSRHGRISSRL